MENNDTQTDKGLDSGKAAPSSYPLKKIMAYGGALAGAGVLCAYPTETLWVAMMTSVGTGMGAAFGLNTGIFIIGPYAGDIAREKLVAAEPSTADIETPYDDYEECSLADQHAYSAFRNSVESCTFAGCIAGAVIGAGIGLVSARPLVENTRKPKMETAAQLRHAFAETAEELVARRNAAGVRACILKPGS